VRHNDHEFPDWMYHVVRNVAQCMHNIDFRRALFISFLTCLFPFIFPFFSFFCLRTRLILYLELGNLKVYFLTFSFLFPSFFRFRLRQIFFFYLFIFQLFFSLFISLFSSFKFFQFGIMFY